MVDNAETVAERVREVLAQIRPYLEADGVQCELETIKEGIAYIRFSAGKTCCATVLMTIRMGIEYRLCEAVPEIIAVKAL